jgi:hypothetical protein
MRRRPYHNPGLMFLMDRLGFLSDTRRFIAVTRLAIEASW